MPICSGCVVVTIKPKKVTKMFNAVILYSTTWASKVFMAKSHLLLWASSQAAHGEITVSDILICLSNCAIFTVFSQFTNVTMGGIIQLAGCVCDLQSVGWRPLFCHIPQLSVKIVEQNFNIFQGYFAIHHFRITYGMVLVPLQSALLLLLIVAT